MFYLNRGSSVVLAGMVCVSLLLSGCNKKKAKKVESRAVRVSVQKLQHRVFKRQIPVQGTVEPTAHAVISAKIAGTIEMFKVSSGDIIKKGDELFVIDRKILKNQLTMREDEIKVKEAELAGARAEKESTILSEKKAVLDFNRAQKLLKSRAISQSEFDAYETDYKKAKTDTLSAIAAIANAEAQLKQAQSNLTIARKNLDDSIQRAPYDGVITDTYVEENEYVSGGQKILYIEDQSNLEVVCYISAVYYHDIAVNKTPVEIFLNNTKVSDAVITYKAPSIDPSSRTFKIKALIPKTAKLVSGNLCNVNIILDAREGYGLPSDAILLRANNRYIVFACGENNIAKSFDVVPGITDSGYTEILKADKIKDEEFVVVGQNFVNSGALLQVINHK